MRHSVAPAVQLTQRLLSCPGLVITREKHRPKFNSESAEISAKVTRVRIAGFELPRFHHSLPHNHADGWMRDRGGQVLDALRVQITAERLKPRREQHYVRLLDLLCDRPPARHRATGKLVGNLDSIESPAVAGLPPSKRTRHTSLSEHGTWFCTGDIQRILQVDRVLRKVRSTRSPSAGQGLADQAVELLAVEAAAGMRHHGLHRAAHVRGSGGDASRIMATTSSSPSAGAGRPAAARPPGLLPPPTPESAQAASSSSNDSTISSRRTGVSNSSGKSGSSIVRMRTTC